MASHLPRLPGTAFLLELIAKSKNYDADERFMAVHDLVEQLKQVSTLDISVQVPLRDSILRLLEDGSSDVSTVAVKCLSMLVIKLTNEQIGFIADKLGAFIANPEAQAETKNASEMNDDGSAPAKTGNRLEVVTDALQVIISHVGVESGRSIAPKLIASLLAGVERNQLQNEIDSNMSCLALLKQVLDKYGNEVAEQHEVIMNTLLRLLEHPADPVAKRASVTFAPLVSVLNDALFSQLMETLIKSLGEKPNPEIYIQSVSSICRSVGVRVGSYLSSIVPKLTAFLVLSRAEIEGDEPEERRTELLETCLQAMYAIVIRCPNKITPYVTDIVSSALELSIWDPLYVYEDSREHSMHSKNGRVNTADTDEEMWSAEADDAGNGWDDDEPTGNGLTAGNWGDQEDAAGTMATASNDSTWKVRRAAFSVLSAFVKARPDLLRDYYNTLCDHIVNRMKEHDSAVKEEVMLAMRDILHESMLVERRSSIYGAECEPAVATVCDIQYVQPLIRTRSIFASLEAKIPSIVARLEKEFVMSDVRAQTAIFAVVHELLLVKRGQMAPYFDKLIPDIIRGIEATGKLAELNAVTLDIAHLLFESYPLQSLVAYIEPLVMATLHCIAHGLPKNVPAALNVLTSVAKLCKSNDTLQQKLALPLFRSVFSQLEQRDVLLEIKLASIHSTAVVVANMSVPLGKEIFCIWPVLVERLVNESTCQPTLKAVTKMAHSSQHVDCSPMVAHTTEMLSYLHRSSPLLRQDTIKCLEALIHAHPTAFTHAQIMLIVEEVTPYLDEADLPMAHLVLDLLSTIVAKSKTPQAVLSAISSKVTNKAIQLACSALLQTSSLHSLLHFFRTCIQFLPDDQRPTVYRALLPRFTSCVNDKMNKNAFNTLAKCMAVVSQEVSTSEQLQSITTAISTVRVSNLPTSGQLAQAELAMLFLGEMVRLGAVQDVFEIENLCVAAFEHPGERVRLAAALALGDISIGNLQRYLPSFLSLIQSQTKQSYLLFKALKEIIKYHLSTADQTIALKPFASLILPFLLQNVDAADESTRSIVSECLGLLAVIDSSLVLPEVMKLMKSINALTRTTTITALRYSLHPMMNYLSLSSHLNVLVELFRDEDVEVQRQTILTIDELLRHHEEIVSRELLSTVIVPAVLERGKVRPDLIREVDYGAFRQKVDDGKPLRKAAFGCIDTLTQRCLHRVDLNAIIDTLKQSVGDQDDIQQPIFSTLALLAKQQPSAVLEQVDTFPKFLLAPVKAHLSTVKNSKDIESATESLRQCVRMLLAINNIPGIEQATSYRHFFKQVCATPAMSALINQLR